MTEKFIAYTEEKSLKSKKITNTTVFVQLYRFDFPRLLFFSSKFNKSGLVL